jgi:hypothetical protein
MGRIVRSVSRWLLLAFSMVALAGCGGSQHPHHYASSSKAPRPLSSPHSSVHIAALRRAEIGEVVDARGRIVRRIESRLAPEAAGAITAAVADGHGGWFIAESFTAANRTPEVKLVHMLRDAVIERRWHARPAGEMVTALAASRTTVYVAVTSAAPAPPNSPSGLGPTRLLAYSAATGAPRAAPAAPRFPITALAASHGLLLVGLASGTRTQDPSCLVAYDRATGQPAHEFRASIRLPAGFEGNACVEVLAVHQDKLYVGGVFSEVNGIKEPSLARLDLPSGAVDRSWRPNHHVQLGTRLLAIGDGRVFINAANGAIAALSTQTGAVDRRWVWPPPRGTRLPDGRSMGLGCCAQPLAVQGNVLLIAADATPVLAAIRIHDETLEPYPGGGTYLPVTVATPSGNEVLAGFQNS